MAHLALVILSVNRFTSFYIYKDTTTRIVIGELVLLVTDTLS